MSRIGRAVIEVLLKSDQAKAELTALKQNMRGVGNAGGPGVPGAESAAGAGQTEAAAGRSERAVAKLGVSANRTERALDQMSRSPGRGLEQLSVQLERSATGFGRVAGAIAGFLGKVALLAGVGASFYEIGSSIREAFDPLTRSERYIDNLNALTSAAQNLRRAFLFDTAKSSLTDIQKQIFDLRQSAVDAGNTAESAAAKFLNELSVFDRIKYGLQTGDWSGAKLAHDVQEESNRTARQERDREQSQRRESERKAVEDSVTKYRVALMELGDRIEEIMQRHAEQMRQIAEEQLGNLAVSQNQLGQVIGVRGFRGAAPHVGTGP